VCTYLETWHLDIEEFLELRKNTGDDRRRTHDMNTANWIPDLFMKRVVEGGDWTLFSPSDVPDLHDKWGHAFEEAYKRYERQVARGEMKLFKKIPPCSSGGRCSRCCSRRGIRGSRSRMRATCARRSSTSARAQLQPVHRDHAQHERDRDRVCNLGSVNMLAHMKKSTAAGSSTTTSCATPPHRDADARQRHRHQLLRGQQGARQQHASTVRSASASWASRTACT
jgi:ribonucleoside-diphosphate reductase alpha chain